ncbi:DNA cytosine methyltransferase [Rahnella contaminans]|uniref:DNA cytosine methyltransferase n=1 Tax=Rahnella contaminans TaxID=2703882 RepID=UPI003C30B618
MNFIDLFSGCGGFSLGLLRSGMTGHLAIEKNSDAFDSLRKNLIDNKNYKFIWDESKIPLMNHDIHSLLDVHSGALKEFADSKKIDLIVGGPPCQGFSSAGRRDSNDPRNSLAYDYLKVVSIVKPKYVILENVKGIQYNFKNKKDVPVSHKIKAELSNLGYIPISMIEDCADWGVPQNRKRFLLFGIDASCFNLSVSSDGLMYLGAVLEEPLKKALRKSQGVFLKKKNLNRSVSVSDAISDLKAFDSLNNVLEQAVAEDAPGNRFMRIKDLPPFKSNYQKLMRKNDNQLKSVPSGLRLARHSDRVIARFEKILHDINDKDISLTYSLRKGKSLPSEYANQILKTKKAIMRVLDDKTPSVTVTTLPDDILHYDEPRILTVRECARIQSFPDWYNFSGSYTTGGQRRKSSCPKYTQVGNAVPPLMSEGLGFFMINAMEDFIKSSNLEILEDIKNKFSKKD